MEAKVLIKSYSSKTTKRVIFGIIITFLILSLVSRDPWVELTKYDWIRRSTDRLLDYYFCDLCDEDSSSVDMMFSHLTKTHELKFNFFSESYLFYSYGVLCLSFLLLAGIFSLIYFLISRCNIIVTENNISGKTFWGKKVVLPIHMVSAYATSKFFSVIAITTASGFIRFPCIGNYEEIANILQQLLNERQKKTETQENSISQQSNSKNLDNLVKLKNLLDNGIITQEEFETKKKEILKL